MKYATLLFGLVVGTVVLSGCGVKVFGPGGVSDTWIVRDVDIRPIGPMITVGGSQQFRLYANYADYHDEDQTREARWSSSNPSVATINNAGLATGIAAGTTTITALYADHDDHTLLTVVTGPTSVRDLSASPTAITFTLAATGRTFGYVLDRNAGRLVEFASGDTEALQQVGEVALGRQNCRRTLALHSSGRWIYVGDHRSAGVAVFELDPLTGALFAADGAPKLTETGD